MIIFPAMSKRRETKLGSCCIFQVTEDGSLDESDGSGDGEKATLIKHILETGPTVRTNESER